MTEMSPAEAVFFACLEKTTPEHQLAYLDQACAGQPELRALVEKLLAAHPRMGVFLESEPGSASTDFFAPQRKPTAPSQPTPAEGTIVAGRYKLLQQIGEGGMGSVWMADQTEPVKRRVAVKLIRVERGDTKMILSRFEAERQAIALMDHPHIARLLDAGTTDAGQPFFVMELVKGIPLTDYCDQHKLSISERLVLFQQICSAVQHAHQKGIIHRDLKPTNILVESHDGKPVPKVIDFGLAKAASGMQLSDHTLFTAFGTVMGTPTYMAPEQATFNAVDVDTRADVYSLGVILYELLTGTTPISRETVKKAAMDEVLKLVREQDAPKPSSRLSTTATTSAIAANRNIEPAKLSKLLRGDLDWVVLKALEKDRKRRYDSANGLAADIQRHLACEPVIARPPSTGYRLQKAWQRNKVACTAGAAIALSLVIGIAVSLWQATRARLAEQRAVAVLDELRTSAPAFAEQAHALATKEQFDAAIEKLDYAIKLRPDAVEYLLAKGDLLQCQLKLADAAAIYREVTRVQPDHARAAASAKLCDELLVAKSSADGKLSRESLAKLHLAMQTQQRPAAELMPVARRLGEEKQHLVNYWLARLKDLPVSAENPLEKRLTVREDGRLALDLSRTRVVDLAPLSGAPIAMLDVSRCPELIDISPLRGMELVSLSISGTKVADLAPLRDMHSLKSLHLDTTSVSDLAPLSAIKLKSLSIAGCPIRDLTPVRKMPLESINLSESRVADLSPLSGLPIKEIILTSTPVVDFSPLAQLPLEKCILQFNRITDLSVLRGKPLKELTLWGCVDARNYAAIAEIKTLELLLLPSEYRTLPEEEISAIGSLREHPKLRQLGAEIMNQMSTRGTSSKEVFWQNWDREQGFVSALRAEGIKFTLRKLPQGTYHLFLYHQPLSDLSILKGAPISHLDVIQCAVQDLTPLRDLPLDTLSVNTDALVDLGPLRGTKLKRLTLNSSRLSDLAPLNGLPLKGLILQNCASAADVSPLAQIATLEDVVVPIHAQKFESLRKLPKLRRMGFRTNEAGDPNSTAELFWRDYDGFARLWASGFRPSVMNRLADGTWDVDVGNSKFSDLAILSGAPISSLRIDHSAVTSLAPLRGMAIKTLQMASTKFTDLSPLQGMPLEDLRATDSKINDLAPLRGLPLIHLRLDGCADLTDLSPLADCKSLQSLCLPTNAKNYEFLRTLPKLKRISFAWDNGPDKTASQFWKDDEAQAWLRKLRDSGMAIKSAKQLPGGTWHMELTNSTISDLTPLKDAPISVLILNSTPVANLEPLRGMPLKSLAIVNTKVTDLSPLQGMSLDFLHLGGTKVSDLLPLHGMPLTNVRLNGCLELADISPLRGAGLTNLTLHDCPKLVDVSPLSDCQTLTSLTLPRSAKEIEFLRAFPKLERIGFREGAANGYRPDKTAAEFWAEYDAKKK